MDHFSTLVTASTALALGLVALLAFLLVQMWKWNSSLMDKAVNLADTTKEASKWNKTFAEILRSSEKRLVELEASQRTIAEAIYSVPSPVRASAKESMAKAMGLVQGSSSRTPPVGTIDIPSEEVLRSAAEPPTESLTPQERVVGKPI